MTVLLGSTGVGTDSSDFTNDGDHFACKFVAGATGTIDRISIRANSSNSATSLRVGVFTDSAGTPGTRIGSEASVTITAGQTAWFTSAAGIGAAVTSGTTYWICVLSPAGGNQWSFSLNSGSGAAGTNARENVGTATSIAATWPGTSASYNDVFNAYAEDSIAVDNDPKPGRPGMYTPQLVDRMWF